MTTQNQEFIISNYLMSDRIHSTVERFGTSFYIHSRDLQLSVYVLQFHHMNVSMFGSILVKIQTFAGQDIT